MKKRNWMYRLSSKSMSVMAALALMVTTMATDRSACGISDRTRCRKIQKTQKVFKL